MAVCTFDNPATWMRECWCNGELKCAYSAAAIIQGDIPSNLFFFGANVGPWEKGQIVGDVKAMKGS